MRSLSIVLLALCIAAVSAVPAKQQKIIGGSVTTIEQYPFATPLLHSDNLVYYRQACGGTIINNRAVLTAAHCTIRDTANRWRIRVGSTWASSGGTVYYTSRIYNHPDFDSRTLDNDVAVMHAVPNFSFSDSVQAASIAGPNYNLADNQVVWAIGWGTTSLAGFLSEQLRHVQIWTVNQATCGERYAEIGRPITDNMLCAGWLDVGGRDQCSGDSGGPLIHNNVIVGICSWGNQCGLPRYPGVNARVSRYTPWIQSNA